MSRYARDSDSEDDRYRRTTVTRYKVAPDKHSERFERVERTERVDVDDDRRSRYSGRVPYSPTIDHRRDMDRSGITVYEAKETDREWERRPRHGRPAEEMRVETRTEERFDDGHHHGHGHDVERYRKETEYYLPQSPPPAPVIIRQKSAEPQRIFLQEPAPAPIIVPRQSPGVVVLHDREKNREMVRREREIYEDDYQYHHDRREVGHHRGDRERDYAMARYDHRPRRHDDHHSDDDEYHYRRTVRRERSESPHHKRYLAEGALAGAGISALLGSRRDAYGDLPENRGRKVLAGAALGALGTEVARRAHSAYGDRYGDGRSESPDHHHLLKKGLAFGAVALAAAGAAQFFQSNKIDKEEAHRGRSRTRGYHSGDDYSRSVSGASRVVRSKSRRRSISTVAKAALGTAATAGILNHLRKKSRSKSRGKSRSRSKSRLRRVAEIGGVAAAAGVANKLWKGHNDKKERARSRSVGGVDDDNYPRHDSRSRDRYRSLSRSRHRSRSRSIVPSPYSQAGADPELGLVEYGNDPLYSDSRSDVAPRRGVDPDLDDRRRERRRRSRRDRSFSDYDSNDDQHERKRSKSRLRDMAAAGAAAIGIKDFKDRHDRKGKDRRDSRRSGSRSRSRSRSRDDDERRHHEGASRRDYFDDTGPRPHSPPTASGGAYYPPYPPTPGDHPMASGANYTPYPGGQDGRPMSGAGFQPYVPQDYTGYAPPPPPPPAGPPPMPSEAGFRPADYPPGPPATSPGPPPPPAGPPPTGGHRPPPDHVSEQIRSQTPPIREEGNDNVDWPYCSRGASDSNAASKSVVFIPLSPKSAQTMARHRRAQAEASEEDATRPQKNWDDEHDDYSTDNRDGRPDSRFSRLLTRRHKFSQDDSASTSGEETENLPDRFDDLGRPLDARHSGQNRGATRKGTFHRQRQRPGSWDVQGAWQVSGTDGEAIDRLVEKVTSALEGQGSWMGVLGDVLGSGLLPEMDESGGVLRRGAGSGILRH